MLDLFTIAWGKEIAGLFLEGTLPSLLQPGNIPGTKGLLHTYNFYASDEAKAIIIQSELYTELSQEMEVNWFPLQKGEWEITSNFLHQMRISAREGHYMFLRTPDTITGNGSLLNMAKLCNGQHNPILFGFPRVHDNSYELLCSLAKERIIIPNRKLVSIGMHDPWIEHVPYRVEKRGSYWVVGHCTPTICLLPDDKILAICTTCPNRYPGFDHSIPYTSIELGYPWHLIRHSDVYFQVERARHLLSEDGSDGGPPALPWMGDKIIPGFEFFCKQEEIWQGEEINA